MPIALLDGPVIEAGESLSGALDCSSGFPVRLTMPQPSDGWTPANLTFQISTDGNWFNDLYNHEGQEIMIPMIPGAAVIIPPDWFKAAVFLKIRSGRAEGPIVQEGARTFAVAVETWPLTTSTEGKP